MAHRYRYLEEATGDILPPAAAFLRVVTAGRNIFFTRTEVLGPDGRIVAFGAGTHRWRGGSNVPEGVPADSPLR